MALVRAEDPPTMSSAFSRLSMQMMVHLNYLKLKFIAGQSIYFCTLVPSKNDDTLPCQESKRYEPSSPKTVLVVSNLIRNVKIWDTHIESQLHDLGFPITPKFIQNVLHNCHASVSMALRFFVWTERVTRKRHDRSLYDLMVSMLVRSENQHEILLTEMLDNATSSETACRLLVKCSISLKSPLKLPTEVSDNDKEVMLKVFIEEDMVVEAFDFYMEIAGAGYRFGRVAVYDLVVSLCRKRLVLKALAVLESLEDKSVVPLSTNWCEVFVRGLCLMEEGSRANSVLSSILKTCSRDNVASLSIVVGAFCKCGEVLMAERVVTDSVSWGLVPDGRTFSHLISGYCKVNMVVEAQSTFKRMKKSGFVPEKSDYDKLLKLYSRRSLFLDLLDLMEEMKHCGFTPDVHNYYKLVQCFLMVGNLANAEGLVRDMLGRNIVASTETYNIILSSLCKIGKLNEAFALFKETKGVHFRADVVTYNTMIHSLCNEGQLPQALGVFTELEELGYAPNIITYTALMSCCFRSGELVQCFELYQEMRTKGYILDAFAYSLVVTVLARLGWTEEVNACFADMLRNGTVLDIVTYNSLINAFFKASDPEKAFKLLNKMESSGCVSDAYTNDIVIDGLCEMGEVDRAYNYFTDIIGKGYSSDIIVYNTLIKGFGKIGKLDRAFELFEEMQEKDHITYALLARALLKAGRTIDAYRFLLDCLEKQLDVYESAFDAVLEALDAEGYYWEARKLIVVMKLNKMLKN